METEAQISNITDLLSKDTYMEIVEVVFYSGQTRKGPTLDINYIQSLKYYTSLLAVC